ncbi:MAG: TetR/AcrR family transcriptional regulator [Bacteroidota bacterium]
MGENCKTDIQIKDLAKEFFFAKGHLQSSVQELADFAGVNRTLINYYFRSKENLFQIIYWEMIYEMRQSLSTIYACELNFEKKVDAIIDYLIEQKESYPFLEIFNVQESFKITSKIETIIRPEALPEFKTFLKEIKAEMKKGKLKKTEPKLFMIHLFALISYPIIMNPVLQKILEISEDENKQIRKERKKAIKELLFTSKN